MNISINEYQAKNFNEYALNQWICAQWIYIVHKHEILWTRERLCHSNWDKPIYLINFFEIWSWALIFQNRQTSVYLTATEKKTLSDAPTRSQKNLFQCVCCSNLSLHSIVDCVATVETNYLNTDFCKYGSSQNHESWNHLAEFWKTCSKSWAFNCLLICRFYMFS